jgi:hypothetical protein
MMMDSNDYYHFHDGETEHSREPAGSVSRDAYHDSSHDSFHDRASMQPHKTHAAESTYAMDNSSVHHYDAHFAAQQEPYHEDQWFDGYEY